MKVVSQLLFLFLLLGVLVTPTPVLGKLDNATISITFNETLKGFATTGGSPSDTIKDFEVAYIKGKLKGEVLAFSLHVNIKDVRTWLADPLHNALCTGTVEESAITNKTKVPVGPVPQGSLHIFDGGVLPSHQLMMEYSLPFKEEGKNYLLYGVKHIPGNNCLGLLTQITTLYVHVLDADAKYPKSAVLRSGIVKIGVGSIISLAASVRVHGGTVADKIRSFLQFGVLLLGDVIKNCIDRAAFETEFWYLWTSDGHTGVLIDLIKRPDTLELRLVQYTDGTSHSVTRQTLPLEDFSVGADNVTVHFGKSIVMGKNNLIGTIGGVEVNISFATGGADKFFPSARTCSPWAWGRFAQPCLAVRPQRVACWWNRGKEQIGPVHSSGENNVQNSLRFRFVELGDDIRVSVYKRGRKNRVRSSDRISRHANQNIRFGLGLVHSFLHLLQWGRIQSGFDRRIVRICENHPRWLLNARQQASIVWGGNSIARRFVRPHPCLGKLQCPREPIRFP